MAAIFIDVLKDEFNLNIDEISLLNKTMRQLKRADRRYYYENIKPREKRFIAFLQKQYNFFEPGSKKQWLDNVVQNMLERGGEPDISDSMVMNIIGRITVYNHMIAKAEKDGIILNALMKFGGLSSLLVLVVVLTGFFLYLLNI